MHFSRRFAMPARILTVISVTALMVSGMPAGGVSGGDWPGLGRAWTWLAGLLDTAPTASAMPQRPVDPPRDPAERVREVPELRSEHARVFQRADGQFEAEVSARPERYRDAQGAWREI